jgi:hypothetical protein
MTSPLSPLAASHQPPRFGPESQIQKLPGARSSRRGFFAIQ